MACVIKSIAIGKKDAVINKWRQTFQNKNRDERMLSFIIKQALLHYLQEGTFIEIGKIHFNPVEDVITKTNPINIVLDDIPELIEWMGYLEGQKLKPSKVFKQVLNKCIKIIPESESEYLPTYFDFSTNNLLQTNLPIPRMNTDTTLPDIKISVENNISKPSYKPNNSDKLITASQVEISGTSTNKPESRTNISYDNPILSFGLGAKR